ncbi:MAG: hypothetical protein ACLRFF_01755 [Alphaproteobacteria bacterium]
MRNIVKIFGLLSIIAVIPGAMAATSRVSVINNASPRLPSIAGRLISGTTNTVTNTTTSSTAAYYGDSECIEKYTDCIKEDDVCGSDFQECTTNVLFHGQMSKCLSVLYQCSSSGINALFGTTAINALSTVSTTATVDGVTEVTRYTYPTDGSVLGQLIIGAGITNKLTTEQCVRRYTNCLQRDDICGADFELCTTNKLFKKQALLCDSTLQRCQNDGKKELFGSVADAGRLAPQGDSRLRQLIDEGASLAALNAVKTCQKVTDNCLVSACAKNPLSCVEGTSLASIDAAEFIASGTGALQTAQVMHEGVETATASDVRKLLKTACLETIGSNRYCHMTYREKVPSDRELGDPDLQEEVFSLAYSARKSYANTKVQEAMKKFDTKAKNSCVETIKECAMRSCGGGLGSVCYKQAGNGTTGVQVNGTNTYGDIMAGCSAIVNADANCIYAATSAGEDGYTYTYYDDSEDSAFNRLFPLFSESARDPIGAVATLNSLLATSYNDAAIEKMKKQCQTVALSCVKSMCGTDYENCYRNRTDIVSGTYDTGVGKFDRSMNKMGGVLDYNIVIGMCMNTVKNSSVCEEHLKVATAEWRNSEYSDSESWGANNTVRDAWRDANKTTITGTYENQVIIACKPGEQDNVGNENCNQYATIDPIDGDCIGVMDEEGCVYSEPVYETYTEYVLNNGAKTLFETLLVDVEKEVQAKYNAKLTKEQNVCLANNAGGVMGATETGSTFMWVKLKSGRVPANYVNKGLNTRQFVASNDLYGSFCRARITVQSDDKDIQDLLKNNSVAYFAVGDSFTCGSWISDADLRKISDTVGNRELCKQGYGQWDSKTGKCDGSKLSTKEKIAYAWGTVAPALAGTGIGLGLTESGLINKAITKGNENNSVSQETIDRWADSCDERASAAITNADSALGQLGDLAKLEEVVNIANGAAGAAYTACYNMGISEREGCRNLSITLNTKKGDNGGRVLRDEEETKRKIDSFKGSVIALQNACANYITTGESGRAAKAARTIIPIATTLAGGALGAGITASVIKQNRENIKNTAAQQWMDEIGEHIQCYIGTEELGTYGDVVSIELD